VRSWSRSGQRTSGAMFCNISNAETSLFLALPVCTTRWNIEILSGCCDPVLDPLLLLQVFLL
jgi:hypothetical protein